MPVIDTVKNTVRRAIENKPDDDELNSMLRIKKAATFMFDDDGVIPNHPKWPLVVYRAAVKFERRFDNAAVLDALFHANGWGRSWRASIYNFLHYHSDVHEVLGVARGRADVQFGGVKGKTLRLNAGDVVVLPAGTGHQRIKASPNFMVVGAYPPDGTYDECTDTRDRQKVKGSIAKTKKPKADPVYGRTGALLQIWTNKRR